MITVMSSLSKELSKCFPSTLKRKAHTYSNSSGLKSISEKLRFRGGLVWTEDLTEEVKRRFYISSA